MRNVDAWHSEAFGRDGPERATTLHGSHQDIWLKLPIACSESPKVLVGFDAWRFMHSPITYAYNMVVVIFKLSSHLSLVSASNS